jgi:hypothetical protein
MRLFLALFAASVFLGSFIRTTIGTLSALLSLGSALGLLSRQ